MYHQDNGCELTSEDEEHLSTDEIGITLHCQLCNQYLCCASETACNHIFCEGCLNEYLLYLNECPCCKVKIRGKATFSNKLLDSIVLEYIKAYDEPQLQAFKMRLEKHYLFKRNSMIDRSKFVQGLQVDIQDQNYIWCTGKILKIIDNDQDSEIEKLLVKFDGSRKKEEIGLPTTRLAVKGSYTNRKQIPHYSKERIVFEVNQSLVEIIEWDQGRNPDPST